MWRLLPRTSVVRVGQDLAVPILFRFHQMSDSLFEVDREMVASPKLFSMRIIGAPAACKLNAEWHSRFPIIKWGNVVRNVHYVCYTADFNHVPYAVAIWSTPIAANRLKDGNKLLELRRMAICEYAPKNTATWMLAQMKKDIKQRFPDVIRLISYQDSEAHFGTIYKAANWQPVSTSTKGMDWKQTGRERNEAQSTAEKIRWEMNL